MIGSQELIILLIIFFLIIATPVIVIVAVILYSKSKKNGNHHSPNTPIETRLATLQHLRSQNQITEEEYQTQKNKILNDI